VFIEVIETPHTRTLMYHPSKHAIPPARHITHLGGEVVYKARCGADDHLLRKREEKRV
jgi:hypothetical protein